MGWLIAAGYIALMVAYGWPGAAAAAVHLTLLAVTLRRPPR